MKIKSVFYYLLLITTVLSCKKDDGGPNFEPPKPLSETVAEEAAQIKAYLETHFYNYEEFENPTTDFDFKITIDTIAGDNADKRPLIEDMIPKKILVRSREIGLDDDKEVEHTYYYLVAREGIGPSPTVVDSTFVRYEGSLLNGAIFDGSTENPVWFDLVATVKGFGNGVQWLKAGEVTAQNPDGTYEIDNYGVGMAIFPSAMGYYSRLQGSIPSYSPLIFKIDLMTMATADHDRDGVPSYVEDLNNNGYLRDDNTDEKSEKKLFLSPSYNYLDNDDDNDGKLTKDEIRDANGDIITDPAMYPDSDNDGTPDYLDADN